MGYNSVFKGLKSVVLDCNIVFYLWKSMDPIIAGYTEYNTQIFRFSQIMLFI